VYIYLQRIYLSERQLKIQLRWDTLSATIFDLYRDLLCLPCSALYYLVRGLAVTGLDWTVTRWIFPSNLLLNVSSLKKKLL